MHRQSLGKLQTPSFHLSCRGWIVDSFVFLHCMASQVKPPAHRYPESMFWLYRATELAATWVASTSSLSKGQNDTVWLNVPTLKQTVRPPDTTNPHSQSLYHEWSPLDKPRLFQQAWSFKGLEIFSLNLKAMTRLLNQGKISKCDKAVQLALFRFL